MSTDNAGEQEPNPPEASNFDWNAFLQSPEAGRMINRAIEAWQTNSTAKSAIAKRALAGWVIVTVVLFISVLISVSLLSWFQKLSAEATGFLFGVIITGAITVARDFLRNSK